MTAPVPTDDDLALTNAAVAALTSRVGSIEGVITPIAASMNTLGSRVSDAETALADLLLRVGKLEAVPAPPPPNPDVNVIYRDTIQTGVWPWSFDWTMLEHPIGTLVQASDAGANLSVVPDPAGGPGKAMKHLVVWPGRAQAGVVSTTNPIFSAQAKSAAGLWIAFEMFIPVAMSAGGDPGSWLSIMDFHCVDANGANRTHTSPGLMLARDGSMKFRYEWGPVSNPVSAYSDAPLPIGRWCEIEQYWKRSSAKDVTLQTWLDKVLVLTQTGVQTAQASNITTNGSVEAHTKWYGAGLWAPGSRYTRNFRVGSGRLT